MYCVLDQSSDALWATETDRSKILSVPTIKAILEAQQTCICSMNVVKLVGTDAQFEMDKNELICRQAHCDSFLKLIVLNNIHHSIFFNRRHPILAGHLNMRRM